MESGKAAYTNQDMNHSLSRLRPVLMMVEQERSFLQSVLLISYLRRMRKRSLFKHLFKHLFKLEPTIVTTTFALYMRKEMMSFIRLSM